MMQLEKGNKFRTLGNSFNATSKIPHTKSKTWVTYTREDTLARNLGPPYFGDNMFLVFKCPVFRYYLHATIELDRSSPS